MTKEQAINDIIEVWDTYAEITHPEYLSTDKGTGDDLLDYLKAIVEMG